MTLWYWAKPIGQMKQLEQAKAELINARAFAKQGNLGKARVCARRAAGFALAHANHLAGKPAGSVNVINLMHNFRMENNLPAEVANSLDCLLQRVEADHTLPGSPDLVSHAETIIRHLFPQVNIAED